MACSPHTRSPASRYSWHAQMTSGRCCFLRSTRARGCLCMPSIPSRASLLFVLLPKLLPLLRALLWFLPMAKLNNNPRYWRPLIPLAYAIRNLDGTRTLGSACIRLQPSSSLPLLHVDPAPDSTPAPLRKSSYITLYSTNARLLYSHATDSGYWSFGGAVNRWYGGHPAPATAGQTVRGSWFSRTYMA